MKQKSFEGIVRACREEGYKDVKVKDACYLLMKHYLKCEPIFAYKALFDPTATEYEVEIFEKNKQMQRLIKLFNEEIAREQESITKAYTDITFDENKAEMISLLTQIKEEVASGAMSPKDGIKLETEIRTKLNDKFGTTEKVEDQIIQVLPKFNFVCPHVGNKECYVASKDDLIKEFGLIDPNVIDKDQLSDIMRRYNLTQKK